MTRRLVYLLALVALAAAPVASSSAGAAAVQQTRLLAGKPMMAWSELLSAFVNLIWPHFDHYIWPHPKAANVS